jgi:spore photoproduct lyase
MFSRIYIENNIRAHPRTEKILNRFPDSIHIHCDKYGEVFNRKAQNFRLQKIQPALILAEKRGKYLLTAPEQYGIGGDHNYYFSHMLNCPYDCRYCFLQGMYRSANYVLFINYEDFARELVSVAEHHAPQKTHFFSGYDCDSLALDPISGFLEFILPVFADLPGSLLELRTKSTQIRGLLNSEPLENCVVAFSLSPDRISRKIEHGAPDLNSRLSAMDRLQKHGWRIGLRFDPVIYDHAYRDDYAGLFREIFQLLDPGKIHSVTLGTFRLPHDYYQKISELYPQDRLFAAPLQKKTGQIQYLEPLRREILSFCHEELLKYIPCERLFPCENITLDSSLADKLEVISN